MKRTLLVLLILCAAMLLGACGRSAITPRPYTPTPVPELNVTRAPGKSVPVLVLPTETPPPPKPTETPPSPTVTSTLPPTATPTRTVVRVRPTATSAGPLKVAVYVVSCRLSPTTGKSGNVTVQISVEPTGGNGEYHYFNQGVEALSKFIDILWEKGSRLTGTVKVISGDGQSIEKRYDIPVGDLDCK